MSMPDKRVTLDISTMNPKQETFFKARCRFVAYGGARGGGKSWAIDRKAPLMALHYTGIKILLLRRTYKDLERNHVRTLEPLLKGVAKYSKQEKCFHFPNGSLLELGYCASESDVLQYQGQEYDVIFIDEATQFTEYQFETLTACLRGANSFPKRMYLTCNPGGVGHEWVKRLFISKRYKETENADDYTFIPATVFDNKALLENDPGYVRMLDNLSDGLRQAWRDGNWDMLAGQYFSEFDRSIHVVEPFVVPEHWKRYRTIDYGLDCLACLWIAVDERGNYYVYREYAEEDKVISAGSADITALSEGEDILYTVAPDDLWARSQETAKSKADIFRENGLTLLKGNVLIDGNTVMTQNLKLSGNVTWDMSNSPVKSQYSVNGTDNWHDTYTSGDMYMHMSFDGGKTWSNATRVVGANGTNGRDGRDGSDANVTPQNVFNALTAGGEEQGIFAAFVNNENQLYINGAFIQADSLACTKLYAKGHLDGYHAKLAGNIGDFGVYNSLADSNANPTNANCIWGIYSGGDGAINFYSYGDNYGGYNSNAETYFAKGKWDFSNCDSIIWGENAPVARFG